MGVHKSVNRVEREQYSNSGFIIRNISISLSGNICKRLIKMATLKGLWLIFDFIGVPISLYTAWINIDNFKGWLLTALSVIYIIMRLYFAWHNGKLNMVKKRQENELRQLEIDHKKLSSKK